MARLCGRARNAKSRISAWSAVAVVCFSPCWVSIVPLISYAGITPMLQVIRGVFQDKQDSETKVSIIFANKTELDICKNFFRVKFNLACSTPAILSVPQGNWRTCWISWWSLPFALYAMWVLSLTCVIPANFHCNHSHTSPRLEVFPGLCRHRHDSQASPSSFCGFPHDGLWARRNDCRVQNQPCKSRFHISYLMCSHRVSRLRLDGMCPISLLFSKFIVIAILAGFTTPVPAMDAIRVL